MKSIIYKKLGETIYHEKLANGLEVFILPKKGFNKTFATFTTKYGSVDNKFSSLGKECSTQVPDGIAHFLEHKMFESEKGDVFRTFAKQGASVNAFTNFTRTAYTVSATSEINKNLITLLDFVQDPYFTDETVEKERGIIEQEIKMYDDNPDWRARFGILENMYKSHPVKIDIAGTIDSINQITKEDLYSCYNTFYHPNNMLLFIIGPVVPEEVIRLIRNNQEKKTFRDPEEIQRIFPNEDAKVNRRSSIMKLPVQIPKVFIGYKESNPMRQGKELLKYELSLNVLLELMFGKSSKAYEKMYDNGYLDDSFTFDYTNEKYFGFSVIGGGSQEPEEIIKIVNETIVGFKKESIKKEDAQRVIKKEIGSFLSAINSPQFIANQFTRYRFNDMDLFDVLPTLENLTEKDLEEVLHLHFSDESRTTIIVKGD
ncbi:pitrilysin family protein (plasmid) [Bacillus mycoides]|uniref:EF-P 5-aminopentanol modification-associated protein YfmH n=1 Tax=Bacillus mycoides TaxID=1405 RepID=UPI0024AD902A|nr:pitrilysin family protein [Bacillus mycoides]MDI6535032.1 pitrilysin family protein [Bacillus mycoides]WJE61421.1 pitrilysin family protein [Bacillus mycoides]WJE67369.1 pitrilysin family protein [Bacillus mycoides]WJE73655.1 pitrilysin family protein [Bacillus mycoides]